MNKKNRRYLFGAPGRISRSIIHALIAAVIVLSIQSASAQTKFIGDLRGGGENPPNASSGLGSATVLLSADQTQITVDLNWQGLQAPATAAHIHGPGGYGTNAPVLFPLSSVPAATAGAIPEQTFAINAGQVQDLFNGFYYIDVHSSAFPGGEIRGQLFLGALPVAGFSQPTSKYVAPGSAVSIYSHIFCDGNSDFQWFKDGSALSDTSRISGSRGALNGSADAALQIANVQAADAGRYWIVATSSINALTSVVATVTVNANPSVPSPFDGLVSWWPADGNGNDVISGNNVTGGVFAPGFAEKGFDITAPLSIANAANLAFSNQFTIEGWITRSITSDTVGSEIPLGTIFSSYNGPGNRAYRLRLEQGPLNSMLALDLSADGTSFDTIAGPDLGQAFTPQVWNHVAVTFDRGQVVFYLYGIVYTATQSTVTSVFTGTTGPVQIGDTPPAEGDIGIDELAVYDRALTASEIQAIYKQGSAGKYGIVDIKPAMQSVNVDQPATLAAVTVPWSPVSLQWQKDGANLANDSNHSGVTGSALTISAVQVGDAGSYQLVANYNWGSITSTVATLTPVGYALTASVTGAGTAAKNPDKPFYAPNAAMTLTAVADSGWAFTGWSGDASGSQNPLIVTMTTNKSIIANFHPQVSVTSDDGTGSLRQAIANGLSSGISLVTFATNLTGTITLTNGELDIPSGANFTIAGPGANNLTIDGHGAYPIFTVASASLTLSGLTMSNGIEAIETVSGTVSVSNCVIISNTACGLYNGTNSTMVLNGCTIAGNRVSGGAARGGGILNATVTSSLFMTNCTVSGNTCFVTSGLGQGGGIASFGPLTLMSCTVCSNSASRQSPGTARAGGVSANGPVSTIGNTIIAGNVGANGNPDCLISGFTNLGYNLIGATNGSAGWTANDLVGSSTTPLDPMLGPLQDNGGTTPTHSLLSNSPAIDAGESFGLATDQRGQPRQLYFTYIFPGDGSDIGAVEVTPTYTLTFTTNGNGTVTVSPNQSSFPYGTVVTITATPAVGWSFTGWTGDLATTNNPLNGPLTASANLTANFTLNGPPPTNSIWANSASDRWETAGNWVQSALPAATQNVFITNGGSKTVTVDATTATSPSVLTMANLTIGSPGSPAVNTLSISNLGSSNIFYASNTLTLLPGGLVNLSGSTLQVDDATRNGANQYVPNVKLDGLLNGNTASLVFTNATNANLGELVGIGVASPGAVNLTNGLMAVYTLEVGEQSQGTLTLVNCTTTNMNGLYLARSTGSSGTLTLLGGRLDQRGGEFNVGNSGVAQMTVSNAILNVPSSMVIGYASGSSGAFTNLGSAINTQLMVIGFAGTGSFQMSGGSLQLGSRMHVGLFPPSQGVFNLSGGTATLPDQMELGFSAGASGALNVSGGEMDVRGPLLVSIAGAAGSITVSGTGVLKVTNPGGSAGYIDLCPGGSLAVNGGTLQADTIDLNNGTGTNYAGTYTQSGGTAIVNNAMIIGDCAGGVSASATLTGGTLYVTNSAHNAVLDVRNGTLTLNAGATLVADTFITTNSCAQFVRHGGTLIVAGQVIAPTPPVIGNVIRSGTNLVVSGGSGTAGGNFIVLMSTNVSLPLSNWTRLATNAFDGNGNFSFTNGMGPGASRSFYRLQLAP